MPCPPTLRLVREEDAPALLAIYAPYVNNTPVTFEVSVPSLSAFSSRIRGIAADYPYLVCDEGGRISGYAYAHRQFERAAYGWNAELTVYLEPAAAGHGRGRALYTALLALLRLQGVQNVYSLVTVPNPASEGLHEAFGFRRSAVFSDTGFKCGAWRNVAWFEKALGSHASPPASLRSIKSLSPDAVQKALDDAASPLAPLP